MKHTNKVIALSDSKKAFEIKSLISKKTTLNKYKLYYIGNEYNKFEALRFEPDYIIENGNIFTVHDDLFEFYH